MKKIIKIKKNRLAVFVSVLFRKKNQIKYRAKLESVSLVEKSPRENYSL